MPIASPCRILLVEPDPDTRTPLLASLERWGHTVVCSDLPTLLDKPAQLARSALLLLDPTAPLGWRTLRRVRERAARLPVMAMLPRDDYFDRVLALESGADALIAKPVDPRELQARIHSLQARSREAAAPEDDAQCLSFGRWRLDPLRRRLSGPGGFSTPLSPAECRLLRAFLERPQSVLRRQELLELAGTDGGAEPLQRSVDLMVSRLRLKLQDDGRNPQLIRTVRGIGYLFDDSLR